MDKEQLSKQVEAYNEQYLSKLADIRIVSQSNFTKTKAGKIGDILSQRHSQRSMLFWFALIFVSVTTIFVLGLVAIQAYLNYRGRNVKLVEPTTLQIIVTGIFVQFIGLVGIITKSIWNDKPYLDAGVIAAKKEKSK